MIQPKIIAVPCPYMIFDPDGYHTCELIPAPRIQETSSPAYHFCLCAWFYDVCNPGFTMELSIDPKTQKIGSTDTFDFPESEEYKDMIRCTMTEDDVPKLCPKGYTFKQIDAKIEPLMNRVKWGHRPSDKGDSQ